MSKTKETSWQGQQVERETWHCTPIRESSCYIAACGASLLEAHNTPTASFPWKWLHLWMRTQLLTAYASTLLVEIQPCAYQTTQCTCKDAMLLGGQCGGQWHWLVLVWRQVITPATSIFCTSGKCYKRKKGVWCHTYDVIRPFQKTFECSDLLQNLVQHAWHL